MKRILYFLIILIIIAGLVGIFSYSVVAQNNKATDPFVGNAKKGKYFFKDVCRSCHMPDSSCKELTPMTKTMDQWGRYFKIRYFLKHKDVEFGDKPLLDAISPEIIEHIKTFLIKHAADSDQPQTCG